MLEFDKGFLQIDYENRLREAIGYARSYGVKMPHVMCGLCP